jgi:hypothetical protein
VSVPIAIEVTIKQHSSTDALADNVDAIHNMPISLQIVGRRLEEEKVLWMTDKILEAL